MPLLAPCYPWWRYPVKPPETPSLDYTSRKGELRAVYPVLRYTKAECAACVPEKAKEGNRGRLSEKARKDKRSKRSRRDEARKLVLPGTWTFHGADKPYDERYTFTDAPKRKARRVRPSFRDGWKPDRRQSLPAWRPAKDEVPVTNFDWKPDRQHYFGAWEQQKFVRWTPTPRPIVTDFSHFLGHNSFLQHKVEGITE